MSNVRIIVERRILYITILLLFSLSLRPGVAIAQSFLSRTYTIEESKPEPSSGAVDSNKMVVRNDTAENNRQEKNSPAEVSEAKKPVLEDQEKSTADIAGEIAVATEKAPKQSINSLLQQISDLIDKEEYGHAKALLESADLSLLDTLPAEKRFKNGELYRFLLMKTSFLLGDYQAVVDTAPSYFAAYGNGDHYYISYYYFAVALDQLKKPLQMVYLVTEDFFNNLSRRESHNLRQLLINDALNREQPLVAYRFMLDSDGQLISGFNVDISDIIKKIQDISDIDEILDEGASDHVKSLAELRKVQLLIRDGAYEEAREFLSRLFASDSLDSTTLAELQSLRNYVDIALNTDPYRIGVILPISHKRFGLLARQVLDGLELALQARLPGEHKLKLIIKDSALNSDMDENDGRLSAKERDMLVQQQVRELIEKDRVIAILGPLAKNTSLAAGETAEYYKVPVISFSLTEELGKGMPFLFRFQRNRIAEAKDLARYALDYLGARRFVLFYTVDSSGKGFRVMRAFDQIVEENGGIVTGISPVRYGQVDFKQNYMSVTGGYKKKLDLDDDENNKKEKDDPVIDFDLMFAPVPLNTLKIMLDFNRSFDAENVWVLSGAEINVRENQLLTHTGRLRFIDAFPIGSTGTYLQPFYEEHWRSYNFRSDYQPPTSYTIYAYEALEIVAKLLNDPRYHNRESLRNAIQKLVDFPILTGKVSCDRNGELVKELTILKIKSRKTVAVF